MSQDDLKQEYNKTIIEAMQKYYERVKEGKVKSKEDRVKAMIRNKRRKVANEPRR